MMKKLYAVLVCLLGVSGLSGMDKAEGPKAGEIGYIEKLDEKTFKLALPNDFTLEKHQTSQDGTRAIFYHGGWVYDLNKNNSSGRIYVKDKPLCGPSLSPDGNVFTWVNVQGELLKDCALQTTITDYANLESLQIRVGNNYKVYLYNGEEVRMSLRGYSEAHYRKENKAFAELVKESEVLHTGSLALFSEKNSEKIPLPASFNEWFETKSYKWHYFSVATLAAAVISGVSYYLYQKKKAEKSKKAEKAELEEQTAETVVG